MPSQEQMADLERMYRAGVPVAQIADALGIHLGTAYRWLDRAGIRATGTRPVMRRPGPPIKDEPQRGPRSGSDAWHKRAMEMAELYSDGMTLKQVGVIYDLTQERVRQILNELEPGFTKRGRKQEPKASPAAEPGDQLTTEKAMDILYHPDLYELGLVREAARQVSTALKEGSRWVHSS